MTVGHVVKIDITRVDVQLLKSVEVMVKVKVRPPAPVGVPVIVSPTSARPGGSEPLVNANV